MKDYVEIGYKALKRIDAMLCDNTEYFFGWPDMEAEADSNDDRDGEEMRNLSIEIWTDAIEHCMNVMNNILWYYEDGDTELEPMTYEWERDGFGIICYAYEHDYIDMSGCGFGKMIFDLKSVAEVAALILRRTVDHREW